MIHIEWQCTNVPEYRMYECAYTWVCSSRSGHMHARARASRGSACAARVQKSRFAGVETATPCLPGCVRACLSVPWSLHTLHASVRRSQRLLRSFWQTGDRDFCQPTSTLSRPRSAGRPARLACSSCCRRRCTSIYTVPTLASCCIPPWPMTLSKSRCLNHPFCSSRRKTVHPPILSPCGRVPRARAKTCRFQIRGRI